MKAARARCGSRLALRNSGTDPVAGVHDATEPGNTPLDHEEREGLIPQHIVSRGELNQWESLNIRGAHDWLAARRTGNVLSVEFLGELHRRMFDETWTWAGAYRNSDKTISPHHWTEVPRLMRDLIENTRAQHGASDKSPKSVDDVAMRFHHALVRIHPWPNGNGRHGRLATDVLLLQWGRPVFAWGDAGDLKTTRTARARYIAALENADGGEFALLRRFVRS